MNRDVSRIISKFSATTWTIQITSNLHNIDYNELIVQINAYGREKNYFPFDAKVNLFVSRERVRWNVEERASVDPLDKALERNDINYEALAPIDIDEDGEDLQESSKAYLREITFIQPNDTYQSVRKKSTYVFKGFDMYEVTLRYHIPLPDIQLGGTGFDYDLGEKSLTDMLLYIKMSVAVQMHQFSQRFLPQAQQRNFNYRHDNSCTGPRWAVVDEDVRQIEFWNDAIVEPEYHEIKNKLNLAIILDDESVGEVVGTIAIRNNIAVKVGGSLVLNEKTMLKF